MESEKIINNLKEFLSNSHLTKHEDDLYVYHQGLGCEFSNTSSLTIKSIFTSSCPRETIRDIALEIESSLRVSLVADLLDSFKRTISENDFYKFEDDIIDYLYFSTDCYLDEKFIVEEMANSHLVIAVEDEANHEFALNRLNDGILEDGALKWLIKQQGYSLDDFYSTLNGKTDANKSSKFLKSVCQEICNTTTDTNKLTVLLNMKISDILDWNDIICNQDNLKDFQETVIKVPKNARIGLVDTHNGAGSTIEIELENDLNIPLKYIYDVKPDDVYCKHSVESIYNPTSSFWSNFSIEAPEELIDHICE